MDTPDLHAIIVVAAIIGLLLVISIIRGILSGLSAAIAVFTFPFRCVATGCCWAYHLCDSTKAPIYINLVDE